MKKLNTEFYEREDVRQIARDMLGKLLVTRFGGQMAAGRIVETEAYNGIIDKASHAYGGRRTNRTEIMYRHGGTAYIYLCYGIHHLFNVVTNKPGIPHAILVRAIEPVKGLPLILSRTGKNRIEPSVGSGPGKVSRALGIQVVHSGLELFGNMIYLAEDGYKTGPDEIIVTPRIGVDYAGEDAKLPYRFFLKNNLYVSARTKFKDYALP